MPTISACVGDLDAVDGDTLVVAKQVRRGECADAIAGLAEDARGESNAGALAVSAGNGDDGTCGTPPIQAVEGALQANEAEIDGVRMQRFLPCEPIGESTEPRAAPAGPGHALSRPERRACA